MYKIPEGAENRAGPLDKGFLPFERRILRFSVGDQRGFFLLRLMLAAILLFRTIETAGSARWLEAIPLLYAVAAGIIYWLRKTGKLSEALSLGPFVFDAVTCFAVFYLTAENGGGMYTILLLLILGSCLLQKPILIFSISLTACLTYGLLALHASAEPADILLTRLPVLLLMALFGIHIADYAGWVERRTAELYEERLAWMQRLSMVGKAMAAVLHEAKTPLGTIVLTTESAAEMLREGKKPTEELRIIAEEADHACAVLQNFLDFVKPVRLEMKPLRAHETLLQAIDMIRIRLDERNVTLEHKVLDNCDILGSSRHLVQAFTNVLNNAVDAMPSGGKLAVWMEKRDGKVQIHIQDTGVGMNSETLDRLFEPFTTSKAGPEGHGLGLSIVRWIMQEHRGDIRIQSAGTGAGSRVTLLLPLLS